MKEFEKPLRDVPKIGPSGLEKWKLIYCLKTNTLICREFISFVSKMSPKIVKGKLQHHLF